MRRSYAVLTVIVAVLIAITLFVVAIVPVIADQVRALTDNVPHWLDELQRNRQVQRLDDEYDIIDKIQDYVTDGDVRQRHLRRRGRRRARGARGALQRLHRRRADALLPRVAARPPSPRSTSLAPASRRDRVSRLGDRIIRSVGGYVSGAFVVAMCAGISSLVFLFIVGLGEYAVALAFVVALLDVIPMIGATIGAVIVTAIAFATDWKIGARLPDLLRRSTSSSRTT